MLNKVWFFCSCMLVILLSACTGSDDGSNGSSGSTSYKFAMDNPLDEAMVVVFDDTHRVEIPKYEAMSVYLTGGIHKVKASSISDSLLLEAEFEAAEDGILNLTRSQYLIVHGYYSVDGDYSLLDEYTFQVNDSTSFGGVRAERVGSPQDLIVHGNWDYDLDEKMPERIDTFDDDGAWKTKVFREDDYVFLLQLEKILDEMNIDLDSPTD